MRSLALPQDSEGFVRRECPHCHRQFKTRPLPGDGLAVLRRLGAVLAHENPQELDPGLPRVCLYCGRPAAADAWLTAEQQEQLAKLAGAWASEVRRLQLRWLLPDGGRRTLGRAEPLAALPPEPDDLTPVLLLCCGEEAKGVASWRGALYCPRCAARQHTGRSELTLALVRE